MSDLGNGQLDEGQQILQEILASHGAPLECPKCGSSNISAREFENVDNLEASRKVDCLDCEVSWWEVYIFNHVEED